MFTVLLYVLLYYFLYNMFYYVVPVLSTNKDNNINRIELDRFAV